MGKFGLGDGGEEVAELDDDKGAQNKGEAGSEHGQFKAALAMGGVV